MKQLALVFACLMSPVFAVAQSAPAQAAKAGYAAPGSGRNVQTPAARTAKPAPPAAVAAASAAMRPEPVSLSDAEVALAQRVHLGKVPCELGASVQVDADDRHPGYFHVTLKQMKFHMAPVETSTGAIRLEDRHAGAVWLQLANKSMLVSTRLGQRLVDACMNPGQVAVAQAMEKNPAPSVLDLPRPAPASNAVAFQEAAN